MDLREESRKRVFCNILDRTQIFLERDDLAEAVLTWQTEDFGIWKGCGSQKKFG